MSDQPPKPHEPENIAEQIRRTLKENEEFMQRSFRDLNYKITHAADLKQNCIIKQRLSEIENINMNSILSKKLRVSMLLCVLALITGLILSILNDHRYAMAFSSGYLGLIIGVWYTLESLSIKLRKLEKETFEETLKSASKQYHTILKRLAKGPE